ncbi:hypothetical protein BDY21DRAFT_337079 [Lineolata rhizophorae]|uniref:Uncharacterized protein n=1 Tax=Lineolata rhizophorae TaxID=578093 RepID=A0A6A6P7Q6_9PEZI|nr:hypothetical protein BDY21DRAFT_337079 [Lineolata rhizophorae]
MASRRINESEKTYLDSAGAASGPSGKSNIAPAVPAAVIYKLLGFTFAMITAPISIYFLSLNSIFGGNSTFAGFTAAISANVILIAYVVVAFKEDQSERLAEEQRQKKSD